MTKTLLGEVALVKPCLIYPVFAVMKPEETSLNPAAIIGPLLVKPLVEVLIDELPNLKTPLKL